MLGCRGPVRVVGNACDKTDAEDAPRLDGDRAAASTAMVCVNRDLCLVILELSKSKEALRITGAEEHSIVDRDPPAVNAW